MRLNWQQRLESSPSYKKVNEWLEIDPCSLVASKRELFIRNIKIVTKVVNGHSMKDVAREFNVSPAAVSKLLKRTFAGDADKPPALTAALIPMTKLNKDKRRAAISDFKNSIGARCSFHLLLDTVPGLDDFLNEIVKLYVKRARHGENLTPSSFHRQFLAYLSDQNWPKDRYPFDQKKLGYETCRKYFHKLVAKFSIPRTETSRVRVGPPIDRAYDEVQIDSQTLDIHTTAYFEFDGIMSPHRVSRMTLFVAIDVATDCILSYKLCFTDSPTQYDLLNVLIGINKEWKPRKLNTPGLAYEPGSCLPSSLGSEYRNVGIGTISLDNAQCHHSESIKDFICNEMGATMRLGIPAHPKTRNVVEYAFNRINKYIHRFSCTTGSHPNDPKKESLINTKKPPILTVNALEDILSVIITQHNNKPQNRLCGHSPLSMIQAQMSNRLIRMNHHLISNQPNPFIRERRVKVCWRASEKRIPYVHFEDLRYSAPNVLDYSMVKKDIIIRYDFRDIRQLEAITTKGKKLGTLKAPRTWQLYKHSIDSRKYIRGLIDQKLISGKDPLHGVIEYLRIHKNLPSVSLSLTGLIKDISQSTSVASNDDEYVPKLQTPVFTKRKIKWQANVIKGGNRS